VIPGLAAVHLPLPVLLAPWLLAIAAFMLAPRLGRIGPAWERVAGAAIIGSVGLGVLMLLLATSGDPTPDSGRPNPVPVTEESVSAGADLFATHCAACHGADARGGGPQAGTTPVRPPSLVSDHLRAHTDGDLFYWITNGLPGGMPAWGDALSEQERWQIVNFLRSLN
jgi:mono/diheme cytochrome c family protein